MVTRQEKHSIKQKNSKMKRPLIIAALFFITLLVASAAYFTGVLGPASRSTGLSSFHKKINILVLGVDQRRNDIGRSNVTCVVTVDPDTKHVTMLWVPRDSRVKIPGQGWNKIGHAYAYGGHKLSEQTVSELLGIPIDYYLAVNMDGFKKVIDALGGVDINVEKRMYYYDPYDEGEVDNNGLIDLHPGMQHMDGNTALEYVRFRHDEMGDIGRIERQQKFAKALLAQVASPTVITKIPNAISEITAAISTDLPVSQMMSLGKIISDAYKQGLDTDMVAGKPVYIDGISYWLPDIVAMRRQVGEIQGVALDDKYFAAAKSLANEYENSIPQETKVAEAPPVATQRSDQPPKKLITSTAINTNKPLPINNKTKTETPNVSESKAPASAAAPASGSQAAQKNTVVTTNDKPSS